MDIIINIIKYKISYLPLYFSFEHPNPIGGIIVYQRFMLWDQSYNYVPESAISKTLKYTTMENQPNFERLKFAPLKSALCAFP